MNAWKKITTDVLSEVGDVVGVDLSGGRVDSPPDPSMGDLAIPCFEFAKELHKSPADIAADWADKIKTSDLIEKTQAAGAYVNVVLKAEALSAAVFGVLPLIVQNKKGGKKVMIEYGGPNTHKLFHIGHQRNTCLGAALVNIHRKTGDQVIAVNYIGDVGAHVAKCLWALQKFHSGEQPPKGKEGEWLGHIYVEGNEKTSADEKAAEESKEILRKLESGEKEITALWEKTREWSMEQFKEIYADFGAEFDHWYFESDVGESGKAVVEELLEKGIAKISQGATIVDLEEHGLGVFLILRSDGTSLYSTKDLALAQKKVADYPIDESIIVTDNRQSQHFAQLFKTLQLNGFDKKMTHVAYEMVDTKDGAMSSRTGNVVEYETVKTEVLGKLVQETKKRHPDWDEKKLEQTAHGIMLGAIKFLMLKSDADKIITFDMDQALSFEGYTGPYIQYSYARIQSVLGKAGNGTSGPLDQLEERQLLLALSEFWSAVDHAKDHNNPAMLCRYLYDVAKRYSNFYARHKIIGSDQQEARLALCGATAQVLKEGLTILGIPVLGEM